MAAPKWAWSAVEITAARHAGPERALADQATYLDRLLAARPGEVFALRWLRGEPGRLRLWLLARTSAAVPETAAARAVALAEQLGAVPPQIVAEPVADPAAVQAVLNPFVPAPDGLAQIGKRVRAQPPERPDAGVEEYLAVEPFARERVDWTMLLDLVAACPHPLALTVTLVPERVSAQVRRTVGAEAARFARLAELQSVELPEPALRTGPGPVRRGLLELRGLVDRAEAAALFGLPLDGPVPGFPVHTAPASAPASLLLGRREDDGTEVRVPVPERIFVRGAALDMGRQLWAEHRIPFLALDPAGTGYRRLA